MFGNNENMTKNITIRQAGARDIPGLKVLWKKAFRDSDSYIDGFFSHVYADGMAFIGDCGGRVVSSAYLLPIGWLHAPGKSPVRCSVTYSVATLPEFRGMGLGAELTKHASNASKGIITICPAEDSLFEFYRNVAGFEDYFYCSHAAFSPDGFSAPADSVTVEKTDWQQYSKAREKLLADTVHIEFSGRFLSYQQYLSEESGGGLFLIRRDGCVCCAAVEMAEDGVAVVKELLAPPDMEHEVLSALHGLINAELYHVRTPAGKENLSESKHFAMLRSPFSIKSGSKTVKMPWFGFAFD